MDPFDPDVWRRITPILDSVLDAPLARREAILDESCGRDLELRAAIERLVRVGETETDTLDRPAAELAAELLAEMDPVDGRRPRAGDVLGGYEIRGLLGRGGMGEVFRAFHPTLEREVALKVLPAHLTGSAGARGRLIAEARAASRLDHPNVQTVYDAGETETGRVYLALALYEGPTLSDRLSTEGPLEIDEALDVVRQVADGLAAAHGAGIVHRDIKPSNLIVQPDGRVKILDFGIARSPDRKPVAGGRATYGTIAYMSPEQTGGDASDARVDVWAVGIVLYEMLTGRRPFRAPDDGALIRAIRNDDPEPPAEARPEVPASVVRVLDRCLRKEPADRYPDVKALRADLEAVAAPAARRGRHPALALGAVVLAALAVAMVFGWSPWSGAATGLEDGVIAPATSMAVLPFVPVSPDSAGRGLGRELAVSVSANLDGLGPIRTAAGPVVLAAIGRGAVPVGAVGNTAAALADDLATTSYLQGALSLAGAEARIDATLHAADTGAELGRLSVTGPAGDVAVLTDSVTLAVLRLVWRRGELPVPSYGALTTRSVPALRSYLGGELALGAGRYDEAVVAFDSAFAADSTFWYALWRSIYPRTYGEGLTIRDERYTALYQNRHALPEPDRLLLEVDAVDGWSARLDALRRIVDLFPSYWPGRWAYANALVHTGPLGGLELDEARRALESVLERHPTFLAAWDHLLWIRVLQRDSTGAGEALARLEAAAADGNSRLRRDLLPTYRILAADLRGDPSPELLSDKVEHILRYEGPMPPMFYALDLLIHGACEAQIDVNRAVLGSPPSAELAAMHEFAMGWATACAGDWPAGTSIAAEVSLPAGMPNGAVQAYGLGVAGAWLGELSPALARTLRPVSALDRPAEEAERLWLDGVLAFADGRSGSLDSARAALADHPADHAERLAASLAGFALALAGDSAAAGRQLADLEEEAVETGAHYRYGRFHSWLTPLDRLAAGRWLAAGGDTLRALRMLRGAGAVLGEGGGAMGPAFHLLAPRAALLRARIHVARGDTARAAHHYGTVLHAYQITAPRLAGALEEAGAFVREHDASF